jgi:hypothetical protein
VATEHGPAKNLWLWL